MMDMFFACAINAGSNPLLSHSSVFQKRRIEKIGVSTSRSNEKNMSEKQNQRKRLPEENSSTSVHV